MALAQAATTVTMVSGYGWCPIPAGAGTVIHATLQFVANAAGMSGPRPLANSGNVTPFTMNHLNDGVPLPMFVGASPTATAYSATGVLQFGVSGDGPAPDGVYSVIVWSA